MEDNYVIIGGTACSVHEEEMQQEPRATKDIDIVLIVEALSDRFVRRFWEFIVAGGYEQRQRGETASKETPKRSHEYFRFVKARDKRFPVQIELFSGRRPYHSHPRWRRSFQPVGYSNGR